MNPILRPDRSLLILLFCMITSWSQPTSATPIEVTVGVADHLAPRVINTWKQHPDACEQDDYFSEKWLRTTLEFFLLWSCNTTGGVDATYKFKTYPNSARTRTELKKGSVMVMIDFPWGSFADDESLYKSSVVLPVGSFVKGLYTRPDRTDVLSVKTLKQLQSFVGVTNQTWVYDWAAMDELGVKKFHVSKYILMGRMVAHQRADFFIGEFPGNKDLSQYIEGIQFVPVPGVKVILRGSRHIALSKKVAHSEEVYHAIQTGLEIMRKRGILLRGYQTSGFLTLS
ncbi:hypothetical protein P4S72_16555 [Vibrio sp. PP-XX7]